MCEHLTIEKRSKKIEYTPPYETLQIYDRLIAYSAKRFLKTDEGKEALAMVHETLNESKPQDDIDVAVRSEITGRETMEIV